MPTETLLLVGRSAGRARETYETHADRLARRSEVDDVTVATYETEPVRELREQLRAVDGDRVYAVPMTVAHTHDTTDAVPRALAYVPGDVTYCEPPGRSPAVTEVVHERAAERVAPDPDVSLVLAGFGSSSKPYGRQVTDYHAARLRERTDYGEVVTCYLLQNPTVDCVRYNVSNARSVAVPLFLAPSEATERRVPEELELARGGIEYGDPLGDHPRMTDAVGAELERQRALVAEESVAATALTGSRPLATDGEGAR